jgi:hypothetical protein
MSLGDATGNGQMLVFLTCAGMYLLAAVAVLGTDATKLIRDDDRLR